MEEVNKSTHPKADLTRVVYMILYLIIGKIISMILFVIAVGQLIYSWISGSPNEKILSFSQSMGEYVKQIVLYISFNTDEKPWPSADWPK
jgi:hypothetical protein